MEDVNVTVADTTSINVTSSSPTYNVTSEVTDVNVTFTVAPEISVSTTAETIVTTIAYFRTPWIWDAVNSQYYLQIGGSTVAIIDENGNLKIKGRFLKIA